MNMTHEHRKPSSRPPRRLLVAAPLFALASLVAPGLATAAPVVKTEGGPVRGVSLDGIDRFLGIPYAAPPTGDLRWRPPQPAARWYVPRDATR
jgi:para-nitrobenzyl esterase